MTFLKTLTRYKSSSIRSLILFSYSTLLIPLTCFFLYTNTSFLIEWEILSIRTTSISFPIILDPVGITFRNIVCLISACVILFSSSYIANDIFLTRFTWLVILFVLSINLLIFIPNLISLLIGWDGLGIVSFALVIYYPNIKSLSAGIITALANRLGDVILLTAIGFSAIQGHWNILFMWDTPFSWVIIVCLVVAGITKRAQIPFSAWLPAAIAAPTPVSALVHSSTLVTAGVFLLIRFFPFLNSFSNFKTSLLFIAVITILIAGIRASYEYDIKKIIALSTLSQLGVIIIRLRLGFPALALFHLFTHALFKAMLFLCAGAIIHNNRNSQDTRNLGGLWNQIPLTISCLNIANLALCGAPFLRGFYSKDLILERTLFHSSNICIIIIIFLATGITAAYSLRLSLYSLWGRINHLPFHQNYDEDISITIPIIILRGVSVFAGKILQALTIDFSASLILPTTHKLLTILVLTIGGWFTLLSWNKQKIELPTKTLTQHFNSQIWFLAAISSQPIIQYPLITANHAYKILDQGWLEITGGQGTFLAIIRITQINQLFQFKFLTTLIFLTVISASSFWLIYF